MKSDVLATKLVTPVPGDTTFPVKVSVYRDGTCLISQDQRTGRADVQVIEVHPNRIPDLIESLEAVFDYLVKK